jgi:hypothetical protein
MENEFGTQYLRDLVLRLVESATAESGQGKMEAVDMIIDGLVHVRGGEVVDSLNDHFSRIVAQLWVIWDRRCLRVISKQFSA